MKLHLWKAMNKVPGGLMVVPLFIGTVAVFQPANDAEGEFVVWTIPSPWHSAVGAARLVSTPSRFRAWLGIAMLKVSPTLSSSASPVSRGALKFALSPLRLPFRHARARREPIVGHRC